MSAEDQVVVARIRAGDMAAFGALFTKFWAPLWRFARMEVPGDELVEDIVQTVFVRLWTRRETWAPSHSIQAYLYSSVRNAIIDVRRHERTVRVYASRTAADPDMGIPREYDTATLTEHQDLLVALQRALDRLPEARRLAVTLRYEHKLTYAELAAILGTSAAAAEKLVARTLATLRAWLDE